MSLPAPARSIQTFLDHYFRTACGSADIAPEQVDFNQCHGHFEFTYADFTSIETGPLNKALALKYPRRCNVYVTNSQRLGARLVIRVLHKPRRDGFFKRTWDRPLIYLEIICAICILCSAYCVLLDFVPGGIGSLGVMRLFASTPVPTVNNHPSQHPRFNKTVTLPNATALANETVAALIAQKTEEYKKTQAAASDTKTVEN